MNPKLEKYQFKPGKSGNPKGRGKKILTHINKELKEEGYKPVTNSQIKEAYLLCVGLDEDKLKELIANKEMPMLVRITAKRILDPKLGFESIQILFDRALGKPQNKYDHTTKGEKISNTIDLTSLTDDELEVLERIKGRADKS